MVHSRVEIAYVMLLAHFRTVNRYQITGIIYIHIGMKE